MIFHLDNSSQARARRAWPAFMLTLALMAYLVFRGAAQSGYQWDWSRLPGFLWNWADLEPGPLLKGLWMTIKVTAWAFILTFLFGLMAALARLLGGPTVRGLALVYLEIIRNTPLMVQLFVMYFVLGPILDLPRFWAAVLALSLFEGAYLSEIIRSGIMAVHEGQWQASWCLGLSTGQTFRHVILPQTGPMLLPPTASLVISLIKDSSLVSMIALYDLTKEVRLLVGEYYLAFELWLCAAFIYLALNLSISWLASALDRRAFSPAAGISRE
jgi:polar amino acid transport system permease protein